MGIDALPLRTQSDRRLVRLVREGYESAFEEIVRRYRRPLDRFAASIVGGRSEDVTQDSFRKALVALRRDGDDIELRPWLYRIVRNTALNDLRDRPPAAAELAEELLAGGRSAAAVAEERAEVAALTAKLRALPENQRAALVMRELEGLSHEEIAAALGVSGGAARQALARGRAAVRSGLGALVPLPLLRALAGGGGAGAEAAVGSAGAAAGGAGLLGGSALKVGLATVVVAGGIGAGVAIDHHPGDRHRPERPRAVTPAPVRTPVSPRAERVEPTPSPVVAELDEERGSGGSNEDAPGARHHEGHQRHRHHEVEPAVEPEVAAAPTVVDHPPPGPSGGGGGTGRSGPGGGHDSGEHSGPAGGSGDDGGTHPGSDGRAESVVEPPPVETFSAETSTSGGPGPSSSSGGPGPSSSSGGGGSGTSGGDGSDDDREISP